METQDIITNLSEIFELANNATQFAKEIIAIKKSNKKQDENSAKIGSSGYSAKIGSSGDSAVISAIGKYSIAKAKKGSWITLAEYDKENKPLCVKTEFVDGNKTKEDIEYCLCEGEFREYIEADGLRSAIFSKKGNVYKVKNFGDEKRSYLVEVDGIFAHGETIKQARDSFIYKIGNRDTSAYKNMTLDTIITKEEAIKMYRAITGARESGTRYFVENLNTSKKECTVSELIELTKGQYGHNALVEFFKNNK